MGLENPLHLAILFLIILLLFGARRLPELGRSLGEGMRGFKDSLSGDSKESLPASPPQAAPAAAPAEAAPVPAAPAPAPEPPAAAAPAPEQPAPPSTPV